MASFLPFLCLSGNEISNGVRVMEYIRLGLAGPKLSVSLTHTCSGDAETCLACYCSATDEDDYVSPVLDPAPWYTADSDASAEFLGFLASSIEIDTPFQRTVTSRAVGGGAISPPVLKHRTLSIEGYLYASTNRGMNYGQRWLNDVLQGGSDCFDCGTGDLIVLPSCPATGVTADDDEAFRTMKEVAITDGPIYESVVADGCTVQKVSFQLTSAQPYLYAPAEVLMNDVLLDDDTPECVTYTSPEWTGDTTLKIRIEATTFPITSTGTVWFKMYPLADGETCSYDDPNPCSEWRIASRRTQSIFTGEYFIVDGTTRQLRRYDESTKRERNGWSSADFDGLFPWPDIAPCTDACICIKYHGLGEVTIRVEAYRREL